MSNSWQDCLSYKSSHTRPSPVRELLALIKQPGIISFAGGMPAPDVFPVDEFYEGAHILKDRGRELLQYGTTDGDVNLREFLTEFMAERLGRKVGMDEIFLTTGSQQALDLFSWSVLDPGDVIICEDPSYMAALTVFTNHGGVPRGIPCDGEGMLVDRIPALIESVRAEGKKVKAVYTICNFQNPGGMTMTVERRKKLAEMAAEYGFVIFEDDPYGYVRYEGEHLPAIFSFDKAGNTLYAGSFSKIFAPGSRIGWCIGDPHIIRAMGVFKQSTDLCSSSIDQALVAEYCKKGYLVKNLSVICENYRERRDIMENALQKYLAPLGVTWVKPNGGFFYWIHIPGIDANELGKVALAQNVAFIPGAAFAVEEGACADYARLNFTYCNADLIDKGLKCLSIAIAEMQKEPVKA